MFHPKGESFLEFASIGNLLGGIWDQSLNMGDGYERNGSSPQEWVWHACGETEEISANCRNRPIIAWKNRSPSGVSAWNVVNISLATCVPASLSFG